MKKRILKITAFVAALVLTFGVCAFANALIGNPISKALAKKTAAAYIEEAYGGEALEVESVSYSFKDGYYYAFINSSDNIDGSFTLRIDSLGKLKADTYADYVESGRNTADRINREYRSKVDLIFDSPAYPYSEHIGYGDILFVTREYKDSEGVAGYALAMDELEKGKIYDVNELAAKAGELTLYIDDDTVSVERLSQILIDTKMIFDDAGVRFYVIDCVLEYTKSEDGTKKDGRIEVMDFLYTDIYEDGITERVKASDEAARAYYSAQDAEKFIEK